MSETPSPFKVARAIRILFGTFGLIFAGIGITVIFSMWFGEMGESAPLVFKIFASFISLAFVAMGGFFAISSIFGTALTGSESWSSLRKQAKSLQNSEAGGLSNYVCPHCGAKLIRADVSPLGDVKCEFCGAWFNIHGKR
jgi:hypothetical protein